MSRPALHQLIIGATPRDAITQNALLWQSWLKEVGFVSEIFATSIADECKAKIRPWVSYQATANEKGVLYHHSLGTPVVDQLLNQHRENLIPVYHNVTPARWFAGSHPELARLTRLGEAQLTQLAQIAPAGIGDSEFNCTEMRSAGFQQAHVVPITFTTEQFERQHPIPLTINSAGPLLLFVGRLSPNKCQEDLVRLLYACRKIEPETQLVLIGSEWMPTYVDWINYVAEQLGVTEGVHILGSVSFAEMAGAYQAADLYVSLSEHEGFGMPLIESMYFELPIVAYRSTAVTDTLGDASVTVGQKDYATLAQLVVKLWGDSAWQQRIVQRQTDQLQKFLEPQVKARFFEVLAKLGIN